MIYSKEYWDDGLTVGKYIPVSSSLSFEKMEGSLQSAEDAFLLPLFGTELMDDIHALCQQFDEGKELEDYQKRIVSFARNAVANLALWHDFDALQLRLTDQGWQRQETDTFKTAYKYQEDQLKRAYKNTGFNAIDGLIGLLEQNKDKVETYQNSPICQERKGSIVRSTGEVNATVFINNSHVLFMRMLPELKTAENMYLAGVIGGTLYNDLKKGLENPDSWKHKDSTLDNFRLRCGRYLVRMAAIRLLLQTGSLTDRGMYFTEYSHEGDINKPADNDQIARMLTQMERDAERERVALQAYVRNFIPEAYEGDEMSVKRDNTGRKAFWA